MSIFRSGFIVAFFTLLSRIAGLFREVFLADVFGSTSQADCVNVALKFPNLFRRIFGEGALTAVFIPIYNRKMLNSPDGANAFAGQIFFLLFLLLSIMTIIMQIFMPELMLILAPGFAKHGEKFELSIMLCRISMPYLIFISSSALMGAMLNSIGRFVAFAAAPIILNLVMILACALYSQQDSKAIFISASITIGGVLQLAFMYYCIKKNNLNFALSTQIDFAESKNFLKQMLPAVLSAGVVQISLFISQSMASFIDGAISILSYAERIYQFPLSLIGTAFGTVLLPQLSKLYNNKNFKEAAITQENAIKFALYISTPCAVGICILANFIIHTIYQRGAFIQQDTINAANCLACFSLGLPAFILNKVLTPIFYANCDQKTPLKITILTLVINIILNAIFMKLYGAASIALGSSIAAWVGTLLLYTYAKQYFMLSRQIWAFIFKVILCNLGMAVIVFCAQYWINDSYYQFSFLMKALSLASIIVIGAVSYLLFSIKFGIATKEDLLKLKAKF